MDVDRPTIVCLSQSITFCRDDERTWSTSRRRGGEGAYSIWNGFGLYDVSQREVMVGKSLYSRPEGRSSSSSADCTVIDGPVLFDEGLAFEPLLATSPRIVVKHVRFQGLCGRSRRLAYQLDLLRRTHGMIRSANAGRGGGGDEHQRIRATEGQLTVYA